MRKDSVININGISRLIAWKPGALEYYGLNPLKVDPLIYRKARHLARINGEIVDWDVVENLVVDVGLQHTGDMLIDQENTGLTYHAIGDDGTTPTNGDTILTSEHNRKTWSTRSRTSQIVYFSIFYLGSESNVYIREEGVFGGVSATASADSGLLFSHYLQAYDNTGGSPVDLTFDWNLELKRS